MKIMFSSNNTPTFLSEEYKTVKNLKDIETFRI